MGNAPSLTGSAKQAKASVWNAITKDQLKVMFSRYADKNGKVCAAEFKKVFGDFLQLPGFSVIAEQLAADQDRLLADFYMDAFLSKMDKNHDREITFQEFLDWFLDYKRSLFLDEDMLQQTLPISTSEVHNQLAIAASYATQRVGRAEIAIVLGSGLSTFTKQLKDSVTLSYSDIPFMPMTTVKGHVGTLVVGKLQTKNGPTTVYCFSGRVHAYEGWHPYEINFISRFCKLCGCKLFILTNSAGGCLKGMTPGSIMVIRDHISLTAVNPLLDSCEDSRFGRRHTPLRYAMSDRMADVARQSAKELDIPLHEGTYCWTSGPSYETFAEVSAGIKLGAGAFGMSTVPEICSAHATGMELFGISLATNMAAGMMDETLTHSAVVHEARKSGPRFEQLLLKIFSNIGDLQPVKKTCDAPKNPTFARFHQCIRPRLPWRPSPSDVMSASTLLLKTNMHSPAPTHAVFLTGETLSDVFVEHLSDVRSLALTNIAELRSYGRSASVRNGRLVIGTLPAPTKGAVGKRIICLIDLELEGLNHSECCFLLQAFAVLGVHTVLFSCPGWRLDSLPGSDIKKNEINDCKASADDAVPQLLLVDDVLDRTMCESPLVSDQRLGSRQFGRSLYSEHLNELTEKLATEAKWNVCRGALACFEGPALPTRAEAVLGKSVGAAGVTIGQSAIVATVHRLGMRVCGSVLMFPTSTYEFRCQLAFDKCAEQISNLQLAVLAADTGTDVVESKLDVAKADAVAQQLKTGSLMNRAYSDSSHSLEVHRPVQELYEFAEIAAEFVRKSVALKPLAGSRSAAAAADAKEKDVAESKNVVTLPRTCFFIDTLFSDCVADMDFKEVGSVRADSIPYWKSRYVDAGGRWSDWYLCWGTKSGKDVLWLENRGIQSFEHCSFFNMSFAMRMLFCAGVDTVLVVSTMASCDPSIQVGDVTVVTDHINITGRNPCFGQNENRFGARFFDMGDCYSEILRAPFSKACPEAKPTVCMVDNNSVFNSPVQARLAKFISATSMTTGLASLIILAKHMNMRAACVGFCNQSAVTAKTAVAAPLAPKDNKKAVQSISTMLAASLVAGLAVPRRGKVAE